MARPLTVVDTTVLIDVLRGLPEARDYLQRLDRLLICSEVTRVEILRGLRPNERDAVEQLFRAFRWVAIDESIARRAGELGRRYRKSNVGIGPADLIIAATALEYGAELATANVHHFPMIPGLQPPYTVS